MLLVRHVALIILVGLLPPGLPAQTGPAVTSTPDSITSAPPAAAESSAGEAGAVPAIDPEEARLRSDAETIERFLAADRARLGQLRDSTKGKSGEELEVLVRQLRDEELVLGTQLHDLVEVVIEARQQGFDLGEIDTRTVAQMRELPASIDTVFKRREEQRDRLIRERQDAPSEKALEAEQRVSVANAALVEVMKYYVRQIDLMEQLGLDAGQARADALARLNAAADAIATRMELSQDELGNLQKVLSANPGDGNAGQRRVILRERLSSAIASLRVIIDLLKTLQSDTTKYQKLLVMTTGDVSAIGFDADVLISLLRESIRDIGDWLTSNLARIVAKFFVLLFLLAGTWILAALARRLTEHALRAKRANVSQLLQRTLISLAGRVIKILGILVALSQIGISVGPMLAGLGIVGFIVGFALQDTLSNFASGAMILFYRPFDVGEVVEAAGISGKVSAMNLVSTTILTFDNQTLIVPNNKIWGDVIRNVTRQTKRRVDMMFGIGYSDDIEQAEQILRDIVVTDRRILSDPEPIIRLHELGESSVNFAVRPWVYTDDYWDVYWDITREVKRRFDAEGITIPFPQRDVHHYYDQLPPAPEGQPPQPETKA